MAQGPDQPNAIGTTVPPMGSGAAAHPVDSVFGRTGNVVAVPGDYAASEVTNDSSVAGAFVDDALDTLAGLIPPAAPVDSVYGRTGAVVAAASDYDASQVDNDSSVAGAFVDDALDTLLGLIPPAAPVDSVYGRTGAVVAAAGDYAASQVTNDSSVAGAFVDDALDTLLGLIPPAAPVDSVYGRTGAVVAAASDYDASQVDNDSSVAGAFVDDALDTLLGLIPPAAPVDSVYGRTGAVVAAAGDYAASQVTNDSSVAGAFVDDALDTLLGLIPAVPVDSVFGRTGVVVAAASDYDASQVDNDSNVAGAFVDDALNALLLAQMPVGYLDGLETSFTTVEVVACAAGECRDDTDVLAIVSGGVLSADITDTGAGGRNSDTVEQADTWYYIFIIADTTGAEVPALFLINENDIGGFTFPSTYDVKRRVGMVHNGDGTSTTDLRSFSVNGTGRDREVSYAGLDRSDLNVFSLIDLDTWQTATLTEFVPPTGLYAELYWEDDTGADDYMETRPTGSGLANDEGRRFESGVSGGIKSDHIHQPISSGQQIDWRRNDLTGLGMSLYCYGYKDSL